MNERLENLTVGQALPERQHTPTNVSLFLYNAAIWNPHRIHFDENYTVNVEKHPGVVIDGPLQGDWLAQLLTDWLADEGDLITFEYSNRRASYLGETLTAAGTITAIDTALGTVDLDVFIRNEKSEIVTPGRATLRFNQR
jgi:hydroxyacyl-ACP dehydratase HTD2-like protein with hotdog domain